MKKQVFFGLFAVLLAFLLILSGCSDGNSPGSSGDNAILYWGESGSTTIALVIADPSAVEGYKAAYSPKTGHFYALMVITATSSDDPVSAGEIAISGSQLTFKPSADLGYNHASFTGTLANDYVILATIPGTSYTNVRLDSAGTYKIEDENDIFGGGIPSGPSTPDPDDYDDGGGSSGNSNASGPPTATGGDYNPGRIVTDINVTIAPTFPALVSGTTYAQYYEGDLIDATTFKNSGITVAVTFSDGQIVNYNESNIMQNFVIVPPDIPDGTPVTHALYYKTGFTNSVTAPTSPGYTGNTFTGPKANHIIASYTQTKTALAEWFEDDVVFNSTTPVSVTLTYDTTNNPTRKTRTFSLSKDHKAALTGSPPSGLNVSVGSKTISFSVGVVHKVAAIAISSVPRFVPQVLFDDPRLINAAATPDEGVNAHWLNRLQDGSITVSYLTSSTKRTRGFVEAYNLAALVASSGNEHAFITAPGSLASKAGLYFTYYGTSVGMEVPIFNTLNSIAVVSSDGKQITMIGPSSSAGTAEPATAFLEKRVRVYAIYQSGGKNGPTLRRTDVYNEINGTGASCNSGLTTTVDAAWLIAASTRYNNAKGSLTSARVTLTPPSGAAKSASIDIAAVGYP